GRRDKLVYGARGRPLVPPYTRAPPRPPHRSCESVYRVVALKHRLAFARCPLPSAGAPARRSRLGLRTALVNRSIELSASSVDSRSLAAPCLRPGPRLAARAATALPGPAVPV